MENVEALEAGDLIHVDTKTGVITSDVASSVERMVITTAYKEVCGQLNDTLREITDEQAQGASRVELLEFWESINEIILVTIPLIGSMTVVLVDHHATLVTTFAESGRAVRIFKLQDVAAAIDYTCDMINQICLEHDNYLKSLKRGTV